MPAQVFADWPIMAAPMAGGPSSSEFVAAVGDAGGFPWVAAGYKTPEALAAEIESARDAGHPFGVNLFVPSAGGADRAAFAAYAERLRPEAEALGLDPAQALNPEPLADSDHWEEKLDLLAQEPVPYASFTFGLPEAHEIARLRGAGTAVFATVTTPAEAHAAESAGVDGLIAQGPRAGGHSAAWDPQRRIGNHPTAGLIAAVRSESRLPIVAAGGVAGADAVRDLVHAGANAVAVGTLLLRAHEAGTSETYRSALAAGGSAARGAPAPTETVMTRAFTGRYARALRNGFIDRHDAHAIGGYPEVHHLTRAIRQRAAATGDAGRLHLWAGTGFAAGRDAPVADILAELTALL